MKKTVKIITVVLLAIILISVTSNVFAGDAIKPGDLSGKVSYGDSIALQTKAGKIMGMIRNVAIVASVIVIMVLGVKYMLGSVEEKAEYKKTIIPYIIGIALLLSSSTIVKIIAKMTAETF